MKDKKGICYLIVNIKSMLVNIKKPAIKHIEKRKRQYFKNFANTIQSFIYFLELFGLKQ